jgi:hypothetical protein
MGINVFLTNPQTSLVLDCKPGFMGKCTLIAESLTRLSSRWQSGINNAAETIDIVTPKPNESIFITDILVTSSKKVANSTIVLQFHDGTNTEEIMEIEGESAPVEFSHAFAGGLSGWKDAILQVVTDQAAMHVVTLIGYVKVSKDLTKTYSDWSESR